MATPTDTTTNRTQADPTRKTAIALGVLFLLTWITAIAAAILYLPVLDDPRWVLGSGSDTGIRLGALLELGLIVTNLGTAIVIYPLLRRHNEKLSLAYVAARVVECTFILVGLLAMLVVVSLREQAAPGADPESLVGLAQTFVAVNRWTFLLGPGWVVGIGNGVILGWLMYRSGLLRPRYSLIGVLGGPLVTITGTLILLGFLEQGSTLQILSTIPEMIWEGAILSIYVIVVGFNAKRATDLDRRGSANAPAYAAAA